MTLRPTLLFLPLALSSLLLSACERGPSPEAVREAAKAKTERLAYEKSIKDWRAQRIQRLTRPDGWLSLVGMHWLEYGTTRVGSGNDNGTKLVVGPDHVGVISLDKEGQV